MLAVHGHDISCCGVAFSESGQKLAVGDLVGGVHVMQGDIDTVSRTTAVRGHH